MHSKNREPDEPEFPANRIREWRKRRDLTLEELGEMANIDYRLLGKMELRKRPVDTKDLKALADALGTKPAMLVGENVAAVTEPLVDVPLISWVNAGRLAESGDAGAVAESYVTVASKRPRLFALRVVGSSMDKVAPPGSIIYVDPDNQELVNGRMYVVQLGNEVSFKRYRSSPQERFEPHSFSDDHPIILPSEDLRVLGCVIKVDRDLI